MGAAARSAFELKINPAFAGRPGPAGWGSEEGPRPFLIGTWAIEFRRMARVVMNMNVKRAHRLQTWMQSLGDRRGLVSSIASGRSGPTSGALLPPPVVGSEKWVVFWRVSRAMSTWDTLETHSGLPCCLSNHQEHGEEQHGNAEDQDETAGHVPGEGEVDRRSAKRKGGCK